MKAFADLYSALDGTTSSNAKLAALVEYFRAAPPADAAWAVYFLAGGKPRQIVPERIEELLSLNYSLGTGSVFEQIHRLAPGVVAEIIEGEFSPLRVRPAIPPRNRAAPTDEAGVLKALDAVLEDSVRVHQRSDVPYGLFLSGGVDSATIATLMSRLNERPVTAFTCGFDAPGAKDERGQAEKALDRFAVATVD